MLTRYHLVIRNQHSLDEKIPFNFSPARLLICALLITITLISVGLLLSNTVLGKWLNPAYMEQENTNRLLALSTALEDLESRNAIQDQFINSFQSALEGNIAAINSQPITDNDSISKIPFIEAKEDIGLQEEWNQNANNVHYPPLNPTYTVKTTAITPSILADMEGFIAPVEGGIITEPYNIYEHYGVDIVAKTNEPIKSIANGKVILASFTVETGWVILIQHSQGLLSLYKHSAVLLKQQNDVVKKGEVIAIMGNSGEFTTGPHLHFEVWHDGHAINPESIIKF
jgi:murein DD-endopeptidase MepM/ murein hydrolase activator NlpD